MSELDFDELDKAVNNLMSGVPKVEPPKNDDIKTLDIDSTLSDTSRPSLDQLNSALTAVNSSTKTEDTSASSSTPTTPAAGSLATRRSGRFMDVVHPSSDMKNMAKPTTSRQAPTIEPVTKPADQTETKEETQTVEPTKATEPTLNDAALAESESTSMIADHEAHAQSEWPDPLEMSGYQPEADTNTSNDEEVASTSADTTDMKPSDDSNKEDEDDDAVFSLDDLEDTAPEEPLSSPFITDAKVEKRPLGGLATEVTPAAEPTVSNEAAEHDDETSNDDPNDQLPANTSDVAPILPPELQKDLMAIETAGDTSPQAPATEETPVGTTPTEPATEKETVTEEPAPAETDVTEKPAVETSIPAPTGPSSIPQQYKEEPNTGDQTNGGIYDTDNYHQPLAHPVKKKSGWLWIVWILLLLIIGGGGAAALYLFDII